MIENEEMPGLHIEKFARSITPLPTEINNTGSQNYLYWGDNNLYPNFLLKLYETVPLHQSIINSKVDYLIGEGMVDKATKKPLTVQLSKSETNEQLATKVSYDHIIFGWITLAVQYNIYGDPIFVYHIPGQNVRSNKSKSKFWVCEDWLLETHSILDYPVFKEGKNPGGYTKLYMYKAYVPSVRSVYPSIPYSSAITNMVTEALINDFSKNDIEDGFSAAHIISFFKGVPGSEQADEFDRKFKSAYTGEKGFKVIIDYNNPKTQQSGDNSVQVKTVDSPDYSAKLKGINDKNETNILAAHQAPSRALFGIEQAAGLNGNDLENAFQIFKEVWVKNNRNKVEDALNTLFKAIGIPEIEFKDKGTALPKTISDTTKEKIYTKNELRVMDGSTEREDGDVYIEVAKPALPGEQQQSFSLLKPVVVPKGKVLTDEDFEKVKHLGISRDDFDLLDISSDEDFRKIELKFDDETDIENYLLENDLEGKTTSQIRAAIRKDLGIERTTSEINAKIVALTEAGILGDKPTKKP